MPLPEHLFLQNYRKYLFALKPYMYTKNLYTSINNYSYNIGLSVFSYISLFKIVHMLKLETLCKLNQ